MCSKVKEYYIYIYIYIYGLSVLFNICTWSLHVGGSNNPTSGKSLLFVMWRGFNLSYESWKIFIIYPCIFHFNGSIMIILFDFEKHMVLFGFPNILIKQSGNFFFFFPSLKLYKVFKRITKRSKYLKCILFFFF